MFTACLCLFINHYLPCDEVIVHVLSSHLTTSHLSTGRSPWAHWSLPDRQGQPGGAASPIHLSWPQAWVGALQWICADHEELHPHSDRRQARVVSCFLSLSSLSICRLWGQFANVSSQATRCTRLGVYLLPLTSVISGTPIHLVCSSCDLFLA